MKQPCGNNDRVHSQPQVEKAVTVWENLEFWLEEFWIVEG